MTKKRKYYFYDNKIPNFGILLIFFYNMLKFNIERGEVKMIVLNIEIDNLYMFNEFSVDFTFKKKLSNTIIPNESLKYSPKIKYKKLNIIMGANASGKTGFGNILKSIENFLSGYEVDFLKYRNDFKRPAELKIKFVLKNYLFEYTLLIDDQVMKESIRHIKLFSSYNLRKAFDLLESEVPISCNTLAESDIFLHSVLVQEYKSSYKDFAEPYMEEVSFRKFFFDNSYYYYDMASFLSASKSNISNSIDEALLSNMEKILKTIDDSVDELKLAFAQNKEDEKTKDFYIIFKNGTKVFVPEGNLKKIPDNRLSQGTIEAIELAYILTNVSKYPGVIYLDEQMAYMHTCLSTTMILKLTERLDIEDDIQLFITTHNENVLDLSLPIHSYLFFVRRDEGIKAIYPERTLNKSDRRLIEYVQNNYFDTNPNLDGLWE